MVYLHDSPGDDTFVAGADGATLAGTGFSHAVKDFGNIQTKALEGGSDTARFCDSPGNELLEAGGTEARLWADHDKLDLLYKSIACERVKAWAVGRFILHRAASP